MQRTFHFILNYKPNIEIHWSGPSLATLSASDGASTLALKPMGSVTRIPKQRVSMAPQNSDLSLQKLKNKQKNIEIALL